MDREKVIKGWECHMEADTLGCADCPYRQGWRTCNFADTLFNDVYALLKEQEARVMTLDEVKSFDWDYCYLEEERLPGKEYREICGDYALTCITWPCIASMRIQHGDDRYGKKWRCWSAKPTDEQRQAVKWE